MSATTSFSRPRARRRKRALNVHVAHHRAREIEHRGADNDAVEVVREALGGNQPLSSASRTAVEICAPRRRSEVEMCQSFGRHGRDVHRAVGIVEKLLPVDGECGQRFGRAVVAGIGLRDGKTA